MKTLLMIFALAALSLSSCHRCCQNETLVFLDDSPAIEEDLAWEPVGVEDLYDDLDDWTIKPISSDADLPPDVNIMDRLFLPGKDMLPIVETVTYNVNAPWLEGRNAYIVNYADHHKTSRFFISRSLRRKADYFCEAISNGDTFNVLRNDKEIEFHLVLDLSRTKLWTYLYNATDDTRYLLSSCHACCGMLDPTLPSGSMTPTGTFKLGNKTAVYPPGVQGTFRGDPVDMLAVFGSRWIPIGEPVGECSGTAETLGIHGAAWYPNEKTGEYEECRNSIGRYSSLGCVRLFTEDVEEIFSLVVSRPSYIHIVKDFTLAELPGKEIL